MFSELSEVIEVASRDAEDITNNYIEKRQTTAVQIQKEMQAEIERMNSQIALKDYSPIEHHNKIVKFNTDYNTMNNDEEKEYQVVKNKLYEQLIKLMGFNPCPITEMYKVISSCSNNQQYMCRVWFTLIPIKEFNCEPGGPIRIEWIHLAQGHARPNDENGNISATSKRNAPGVMGLNIPQFDTQGRVTSVNCFYKINQWGEKSSQRTWWEEWVKTNRPC